MEEKTYVFNPDTNSNSGVLSLLAPMLQRQGIDPNVLLAMRNNNGFGGEGGWFMWIIFLFFLNGWNRNGGFGYNDGGCGCAHSGFLANQLNNDYGRDLLMQAIQGNANAISQLASNLNCSSGQIQQAVNNVSTQIMSVGNQVGMSGQQIINAVQSGNCQIANQLSQCCCNVTNAITTQGYESRLANVEQTNILGGKMDANTQSIKDQLATQTSMIHDRFCSLELRELQNKLDAEREANSTLKAQISNYQQTATFGQMISQATTPLAQALASLQSDVNSIKCKQPDTVTVPANNGVLVPSCVAYNMGLYGVSPFNNGGFWG